MTSVDREFKLCILPFFFSAAASPRPLRRHTSSRRVRSTSVTRGRARPPKDANIAGGYLTITNKGKVADRLIGGASPAASQIEVHEMANVDGMMKTRPLAGGLEIKPGKTIELKPGALSSRAARPQGAAADRPEGEGHAGVREGRPCQRSSTTSRKTPKPRMPPVALRCTSIIKKGRAFACPTGWTMGAFTPCSNWRAPHRRISQEAAPTDGATFRELAVSPFVKRFAPDGRRDHQERRFERTRGHCHPRRLLSELDIFHLGQ